MIATALAVASATQMKVDFNFLEEFSPKVQWRTDTEEIEKIMGGVLSVVYVFDTGKTIEALLVGKVSYDHLEILEEMSWRGLLRPARFKPMVFETARLEPIRLSSRPTP